MMIIIILRYLKLLPAVKDQCESFQSITLNVKRFQ